MFGKYKGTPVIRVILTHIGYIYWCFENIKGFKLTDEQQRVYDMVSTAINNQSEWHLPFDNRLLRDHVRDTDSFDKGVTPLFMKGDMVCTRDKNVSAELDRYKDTGDERDSGGYGDLVESLTRCMTKELAIAEADDGDKVYDEWAGVFFGD